MFKLEFYTDTTPNRVEVIGILAKVAKALDQGRTKGDLVDWNDNHIGKWEWNQ